MLSACLRNAVRTDDTVCRLGGDEFLVICVGTPLDGALKIAEKVRHDVADLRVAIGTGHWRGSISVGVATRTPGMAGPDDLIKSADQGLYAAKRLGAIAWRQPLHKPHARRPLIQVRKLRGSAWKLAWNRVGPRHRAILAVPLSGVSFGNFPFQQGATVSQQTKFLLDESQMPRFWYNIQADLPRLPRCCTPPPCSRWGLTIWPPCSPWT